MRNIQSLNIDSSLITWWGITAIIDRCIQEMLPSKQIWQLSEQAIYEYVIQEFSRTNIFSTESIIREIIAARMREHIIASESQYLRIEIARLLYVILSIDKNIGGKLYTPWFALWDGSDQSDLTLERITQDCTWMSREEFLNLAFPMFSNEFLSDSIGPSNTPLFDIQKKVQLFHQRVDFLTGLPNYTKCLEDMNEDRERSIVLFHINNMFDINDAFWRSTGDDIVIKIGKLLQRYCRENPNQWSTLYKFEWTDFALIYEWQLTREYVLKQYDRIKDLKIFDEKSRKDIHLSFSLWVVLNGQNIEVLVHNAFNALKTARLSRKIIFSNTDVIEPKESGDFFKVRKLVKEAFNEDLFELSFQEIKKNSGSIRNRDTRKFECLVRMYDSTEKTNLISPWSFLHVIKRDGKNQALTNIVIQKACEFMQEHPGDFSINITEDDLRSDGFALRIYQYFNTYWIESNRVTFEILEEIEWIESDDILYTINDLKNFGFEIAIDDFGSWYSNFARMLDFQPNSLKIDMKYVRWIDTNKQHRSLVKAIVWLAHDNGMYVVAEWIETPNEQLVIESLWVDYSQGYLIGKPLPYIVNIDN
jgi:diguanylate cyclase (GGDEF)-like protein